MADVSRACRPVLVALAAFCCALLGVEGGRMILGTRLWGGAKWKNHYVTDGLIAMWDGIWNAGWGVHDPHATVWKDLVSSASDGFTSTPTWKSNALALDGSYNTASLTAAPQIFAAINAGTVTVECHVTPQKGKFNGGVLGFGNNRGVWAWSTGTKQSYWWSRVQVREQVVAKDLGDANENTLSVVYDNNTASVFFNANFHDSSSITPSYDAYGDAYIGYMYGYSRAICDVHSVRIYSRALTAAEIAHNYAIDRARFNLA